MGKVKSSLAWPEWEQYKQQQSQQNKNQLVQYQQPESNNLLGH